ncbi:MAG: nitroreductase family protein [Gammaproteobacteria bacterium]|nr:nitroreductase family protein [Gammaproteobacteria bacterium]
METTTQHDSIFEQRWSSRDFDGSPVSEQQKEILIKAAQTAPSCYNEQPWFFIDAVDAAAKQKFLELLVPFNQQWAAKAGMLCFLIAKKNFAHNGKPNKHYAFDCGAAWSYLALQASNMGLSAHAMGGFDEAASYDVLEISKEDYEVIAAIAVGRPTEEARKDEERSSRKELKEIWGGDLGNSQGK